MTRATPEEGIFDVVQIGYGPVGQSSAALLGRLGRSVAVLEQYPGLYGLPRAGHIDHEIMRVFQTIGCAEHVEFDAVVPGGYRWQNARGQTLVEMNWGADRGASGWFNDYLLFQPCVEDALDACARRHESVVVEHGWQAVDVRQEADFVEVTIQPRGAEPTGNDASQTRTIRGRYLIACDGGNSFVRRHLGTEFVDLGFSQDWLVLDFRLKGRTPDQFTNIQVCDPARPHGLFPLGQRHRRFSFMVGPGEREALLREDAAWKLVAPYLSRDQAELIRQTIYLFDARIVENWRTGRILLMGDSAHVMPPFMGQGMCSGIRDAVNLAWKLDLVLRGISDDALLDSYSLERVPHVREYIEMSSRMGRVSCTTDVEAASKRDAEFLSGKKLAALAPPYHSVGILQSNASEHAQAVVGRLGPQGRVSLNGRIALADDLFGSGWQLITVSDREATLSEDAAAVLRALDTRVISFAANSPTPAMDCEGFYTRFFQRTGLDAILVRPDFTIFGALEQHEDLNQLVLDLREQLMYQAPVQLAMSSNA